MPWPMYYFVFPSSPMHHVFFIYLSSDVRNKLVYIQAAQSKMDLSVPMMIIRPIASYLFRIKMSNCPLSNKNLFLYRKS